MWQIRTNTDSQYGLLSNMLALITSDCAWFRQKIRRSDSRTQALTDRKQQLLNERRRIRDDNRCAHNNMDCPPTSWP